MIKFVALFLSLIFIQRVSAEQLVVNQLGYLPQGDKKAYWLEPSLGDLKLVSLDEQESIYDPLIIKSTSVDDKKINVIDFSNMTKPGWYQLQSNTQSSAPFQISNDVYSGLGNNLVKALFLQRSGRVVKNIGTGMARPATHIDDGYIYRSDKFHQQGEKLDVSGGWYDAGDYGKYVATTTITVSRLLEAYRLSPGIFDAATEVNQLPPIIDEAVYGLTWLAKMQREDGAVYRKVSGAKWPGKVAPWQDVQTRYIYGVSTPETAKFAATMAFASRIIKPFNNKLSREYLKMALHAWSYLETQPKQYIDWSQGDDSGSGPYVKNKEDTEPSLDVDTDDRLWALAELYLTTQQDRYLEQFLLSYESDLLTIFEWKNPMILGVTHLLDNSTFKLNTKGYKQVISDIRKLANRYATQANQDPFSIANQRFIWGSNKMTAEAGVVMASMDNAMSTSLYRDEVQSQIDYLLGANIFNLSFVTNSGSYAVRNLHHLYRISTGISLPGFLVGGPNEKAQAGIAPKNIGMRSYVDSEKSYAVNEFAIDYNASLIGLLAIHHSYFN